ncbi:MAG: tripartite tricarboxylate transporter substrate-binding protein [Planctomycetota bacterium]|nr:tripartite tricarboxylate transporter substrate-binding protein [Planctomycetota bacterium]
MAFQLEAELGVPVSVINATGGKGVTGHNRGLTARPDGYTLTMMTFELNTMHWMGLTELTYQDCRPLLSLNEDYAALLVAQDSPWQSLADVLKAIREKRSGLTASGTASGGAWHLALAGWLIDAGLEADDVIWVPSAGSSPSLQQLLSGGVDMVCCSLPEARALIEAGQVRALGVMSEKPALGFEKVPTFAEQGSSWTLGGWRGLAVPIETPEPVVEQLASAVERIVSRPVDEEGSFANFMQAQKFDATWRSPENFKKFLAENDEKLGKLLQSDAMQAVTADRFSPYTYPGLILGILAIVGLGLAWQRLAESKTEAKQPELRLIKPNYGVFALTLLLIAAYAGLADQVGFVIASGVLLLPLLLAMKTRWWVALAVTCVVAPGLYFVFGQLLRVPLPGGWLG